MRRATRAILLTIAITALMTATAFAGQGGVSTVPLNNGQETTDARFGAGGTFVWWIDGGALCYVLSVRDLTAAPLFDHIHGPASRTVAAPVVITLLTPPAPTSSVSDCISGGEGDATAEEIAAIVANPRDYYVNVHTPLFTGGEVRGQLK
jgi:CHRD domain